MVSKMDKVTDICECLEEKEIIECLKKRYEEDLIYTYVSKVLISINPYKNIDGLYSPEKIELYRADSKEYLPPHLYAIANRIMKNICETKPQSILLTGESGSGKTNSINNLLIFLCSSSYSAAIKQKITAASTVFEQFGNARTMFNTNSSRFTKLTEVFLNTDLKLINIQISYILLESCRVYAQNRNETNFHIFYTLLEAGQNPKLSLSELHLNVNENYKYLSNQSVLLSNGFHNFTKMNCAMETIGLSQKEIMEIYKILAAILHIGNIHFEEESATGKLGISNHTKIHLDYACQLLNVAPKVLETSLLMRDIDIKGSDSITIYLDEASANEMKNSLSKFLYELVFEKIVLKLAGDKTAYSSTQLCINLLDIAGFESFNEGNHFEQLCINYVNEKIQQSFVQLMLRNESDYYAREHLDIPQIPFLDNSCILDIFENKCKGVFIMLDDTCKMARQTSANFVQSALKIWTNNSILVAPKPNKIKNNVGFVVRHFLGDVLYDANNFVDKNKNTVPKAIKDICQNLNMRLDNKTILDNTTHGKSTTFLVKMDTEKLIRKLDGTECSFVRCIKPNLSQRSDSFDESYILSQLISSGSIAYQKLMKTGYPVHISIEELLHKFELNENFNGHVCTNPKDFCSILLRACQLRWKHFKIGNTQIFFRDGKYEMLLDNLKNDPNEILLRINKLKMLRRKFIFAIIVSRIAARFLIGRKRKQIDNHLNPKLNASTNQAAKTQYEKKKSIAGKKRKLDTQPVQCNSSSTDQTPNQTQPVAISVPFRIGSLENELRDLLQKEKKKNELLSKDYSELRKKYVVLKTDTDNLKKENKILFEQNQNLVHAAETYFKENIAPEHYYE